MRTSSMDIDTVSRPPIRQQQGLAFGCRSLLSFFLSHFILFLFIFLYFNDNDDDDDDDDDTTCSIFIF